MSQRSESIRKALEVLSHVSKEDYEGMEAEFFATVAKLSSDYESHVRYSIAKENINDYIHNNLPHCPSCGDKDSVFIASPSLELRFFSPYLDKKDEKIHMYTDTNESYLMRNYPSNEFSNFLEEVRKILPDKSYLLDEHLYCSNCKVSFPPNDFILNAWNKQVSFSDIVEWSKNKCEKNEVE